MSRACLIVVLLVGIANAGPTRATEEAGLAKVAAKIKLYCENPTLSFRIDWKAYENLDFQAIIAGDEGNRAADAQYVAFVRNYILTGDSLDHGSPMTSTVTSGGGSAVDAFEIVCRDHAELRGAAAKITTIVLQPISDMKYLSDKETIAFARRTNDWTAVEKKLSDEKRDMEQYKRIYRPRFAINGSTLTVTSSVMGRSGDGEDFAASLIKALSPGGDSPKATKDAPAKDPPAKSAPAAQKRDRGKGVNCDREYTDLTDWNNEQSYATGALVKYTWAGQGTQIFRCGSRSGCKGDDQFPGSTIWPVIAHCE